MIKVRVYREQYGQTFEDAYEFDTSYDEDEPKWIAEEFAEYYHDNKDGWEDQWPIIFTIAKSDGSLLGKITVDREMEPVFYGRQT